MLGPSLTSDKNLCKRITVQIIKKILAPILNKCFSFFPKKGATILAYHQVVPLIQKEGLSSPSEYISSELFEKHLVWLKKRYKILPLSELLYRYEMGFDLDGLISLTIDDGLRNTFTEAFPLLVKHQVPATVFISTSFIGTEHPIWFSALNRIIDECRNNSAISTALIEDGFIEDLPSDVVARLKRSIVKQDQSKAISILKHVNSCTVEKIIDRWSMICKYHAKEFVNIDTWLSWDEVYTMQGSGLIEYGPHGDRHYFFTAISEETILCEIAGSWSEIDAKLKNKIKCFCYPGGLYNTDHLELLEKAHMESAITFSGGKLTNKTPRFQIPRNGVNWKSCSNAHNLYNLVDCIPGYYKKYPVDSNKNK